MASSNPTPKKVRKCARPELETRTFAAGTQMHLEEIDACQIQLESLNEQASGEIINVEQKFNKLRKPYIVKRRELIKKIPNFWSTAFSNHPDLSTLLSDGEEDCFHNLTRIEVEEADDVKSGFRLEFHFSENPYFRNTVLTKEFKLVAQGVPSSISTTVDWKKEMCLLPKRNTADDTLTRKRKLHYESFFEWFNDHFDPSGDNIADIIKDDLWQTPLQYYLTPDVEINHGLGEEEEEVADSSPDENIHAALQQMEDPLALGLDENPPEELKQTSLEEFFTPDVDAKDGLDEEEEEDEVGGSSAAENGPSIPHQTEHFTAQNVTESGSTLVHFLTPNIEENNSLEEEEEEEVDEDGASIDGAVEEVEAIVEEIEDDEVVEGEETIRHREVIEGEEVNEDEAIENEESLEDEAIDEESIEDEEAIEEKDAIKSEGTIDYEESIEDDEAIQDEELIEGNETIQDDAVEKDESVDEDEAAEDGESIVEDSVDEDVADDEEIENLFGRNLTNEDRTVIPQHMEVEEEEDEVGNAACKARPTNRRQTEDLSHHRTDDPVE